MIMHLYLECVLYIDDVLPSERIGEARALPRCVCMDRWIHACIHAENIFHPENTFYIDKAFGGIKAYGGIHARTHVCMPVCIYACMTYAMHVYSMLCDVAHAYMPPPPPPPRTHPHRQRAFATALYRHSGVDRREVGAGEKF